MPLAGRRPLFARTCKSLSLLRVWIAMAVVLWATQSRAGDAQVGLYLSAPCAVCHGSDGISTSPTRPNLAGQKETYIARQLLRFRDAYRQLSAALIGGESAEALRQHSIMETKAIGLDDVAVADLAAYYASLPCRPEVDARPMTRPRAIDRCAGCHGESGVSELAEVPNLIRQKGPYMLNQIRAFRETDLGGNSPLAMIQRDHPVMSPVGVGLSIDETRLIVSWYANQECR